MNMIGRWAGLALSMMMLFGLAVAPHLRADDATEHLRKMQGAWIAEDADGDESRWVFTNNQLRVTAPERSYTAIVTLEPTAEPHPAINVRVVEGPEDARGQTVLGIYKMDDDTLTICLAGEEKERPEEFKQDEPRVYLFELKRPS